MASFSKKFKKAVKKVGGIGIKVVKYAAPIVGTALGGPLGGAAGTALSALAATHRAKNKKAAISRALAYGGAVSASGLAINAVMGKNLLSPLISGGTTKAAASGDSGAVNVYDPDSPNAVPRSATAQTEAPSLVEAAMTALNPPTALGLADPNREGGQEFVQPGALTEGASMSAGAEGPGIGVMLLIAFAAFALLKKGK